MSKSTESLAAVLLDRCTFEGRAARVAGCTYIAIPRRTLSRDDTVLISDVDKGLALVKSFGLMHAIVSI